MLGQQLLNLSLRASVLAFAELLIADVSLSVEEIKSGPINVMEGIPNHALVVNRNRIVDVHLTQRGPDIRDVLLEIKLWSVYANHDQTLPTVFFIPCAHIRECSAPIDTGIGPKLDKNYPASQIVGSLR